MILHICTGEEWEHAKRAGVVCAPSLDEVGFLHCSDPGTVHLPANSFYAGQTDLVLLEIDPARVEAPVRWEAGEPPMPGAPLFPHVYGTIETSAVVDVHPFLPDATGTLHLPRKLAER